MSEIAIWGVSLEVFLMYLSGIVYLLCALILWKPFRREKNELMGALFAFFVYQAISMVFMGIELQTHELIYSNIAGLAVFIGSVYMLKFVYSSRSEKARKRIFSLTLLAVLALFVWFVQTPEREMMLMKFTLWYDIIINGLIVGGAIILTGLRARERWFKVKAIGGGSGVVSCCVVANATMLGGAMLLSSVFQFLAPVLILGSILSSKGKQKTEPNLTNQA